MCNMCDAEHKVPYEIENPQPTNQMQQLLDAALDGAFELVDDKYVESGDTGFPGQFFVDGEWYCCKFGSDSLQKFIEILQGR